LHNKDISDIGAAAKLVWDLSVVVLTK